MAKKMLGAIAFVGAMLSPLAAFADGTNMWDAASSTASLTTAFGNIGVVFAVAIAAILVAWAGLVGLGFGLRKAKKYVTGRHF